MQLSSKETEPYGQNISGKKTMSLLLKLPNDESVNLNFSVLLSTRNLKITIEKKTGIPYELQRVQFSDAPLDDNKSLEDQGVRNGSVIYVEVDMWWKKIVSLSLQGSTTTLGRRVSVPMQQIGEGNRIFVTLFICATRGIPQGIISLLSLNKNFDLNTVTKVTGRSLFHAAVTSHSLKCVEELKKHAGMEFEKLLYVKDKSGLSPLDELSSYDTRMLHYINKFLSSPISIEQVENRKNIEHTRENTYVIDEQTKEKHNSSENLLAVDCTVHSSEEDETKMSAVLKENIIPTLGRAKEGQIENNSAKSTNVQHAISLMAPLIVKTTETSKTIKVGQTRLMEEYTKNHLPIIQKKDTVVPAYSPRPVRKLSPFTPQHIAMQPRPPTHDKKRPVAGKLMESNLRKFSAASHPRPPPNSIIMPNNSLSPITGKKSQNKDVIGKEGRALSPQITRKMLDTKNNKSRSYSPTPSSTGEEKVRRISLIHRPLSPRPVSPLQKEEEQNITNDGEPVVIEMEKDRFDKPWNSWIKAVTVDASDTGEKPTEQKQDKKETKQFLKPEETVANSPLQTRKHSGGNRKISFDQWVLHKVQEQQMTEWQKQQLQQDAQNKEGEDAKSKFKVAKTYEQWQKETEERERQELEKKKKQDAVTKETQEEAKTRRRKESTAKYEQWLLEKERMEFEKEMKELETTKRKMSTAKNKGNAKK